MSTHEMTGGEALARALLAHGAGPMFGMGGFQLLPFYDACRRLGLRHALINDERCGVFAADAYAKVTGRVGLADGTLGPGATNLVTGLIECLNAGSPVVAFVGDTHRAYSWKNMTQEARQLEILRPAVKDLLRVETIQRAPEMVRRAFAVATSGRPGPVVVSVPEDIAHGTHGFEESEFAADPRHQAAPAIRCRAAQDDLAKAVALLAKARRPLILAGGGVHISGAAPALEAFARASAIPVAHTMTGKGAIACTDPLSAGLFGRYDRIANALIAEADVAWRRQGRPRRPCGRGRPAHGGVACGRRRAHRLGRNADQRRADPGRTQCDPAARGDPRRRRWLRGALGRIAVRHQARRARLRARPRLRIDRLRRAGRHRRQARRP